MPKSKNPKMLVRLPFTSKKVYLFKPEHNDDFHVRFTPPRHVRARLGIKGDGRVLRTTGYREIAAAKIRATEIIELFWKDGGEAEARRREAHGYATIGEVLDAYKQRAGERDRTVRNNANALLLILRSVLSGEPENKSTEVLDGTLIRKFEASRQSKASIASYVRQARSVVSLRKMKFYERLKLPDLTSFRAEHVDTPRHSRPRPLDMNGLTAMVAARPALAAADPAVYVANLMFSCWGMRDIEIWNARVHWLSKEGEVWRMHIIDRPEEDFYPKGSEGSFEVSGDVVEEILKFQSLCVDGYLIPGKDKTERHKAIYRRHSTWVSTWIKDRTKTSYELRRYAGSRLLDMGATIYQVRDFLRHRHVATTEQWYAYRLQNRNLPVIGMNNLVPSAA